MKKASPWEAFFATVRRLPRKKRGTDAPFLFLFHLDYFSATH